MYKTSKEILSQYEALEKTYSFMIQKKDEIIQLITGSNFKRITFTGCGSSYSLCKSAAASSKIIAGIEANALAAGDMMLNFPQYTRIINNSLIIAPSRSGSTSELLLAVKNAKENFNIPCICISAKCDSPLAEISDLAIEIPWAFDESVCQTRTVTNLYMVNLMLVAFIAGNDKLEKEIGEAIKNGEEFIKNNKDELQLVSENEWENVVVLADAELEGIAEEGSLAFKEISQLQSNYYHILDVRHGPIVLINKKTLVIVTCSPFGDIYQKELIKDLTSKGATVVSISSSEENIWGASLNVGVPAYKNYGVWGIPLIFIHQYIAYLKAISRGVNPDEPLGLDPWIKL